MGNKDQLRFHYYKRSWLKQWVDDSISCYNYKTKEYTKNSSVRNSFTLDVYPHLHDIFHKIEKELDLYDSKISKIVREIEENKGVELISLIKINQDFLKKYLNQMVYRQPWMALLESEGFDPINNEIESSLHAIRLAGIFGLSTHYLGLEAKAKFEARLKYNSKIVIIKTREPLPLYNTPMLNRVVKGLGKVYMLPTTPNLLLCLIKKPERSISLKLKNTLLKVYMETEFDHFPVGEVYHSKEIMKERIERLKEVKKEYVIPEYSKLEQTIVF